MMAMDLFLHIRITQERFNFHNPVVSEVKKAVPHVVCFDVDNYSDAATIQTAVRALRESERFFLYLQVSAGADAGAVVSVVSQLRTIEAPFTVFYEGNHPITDKMMAFLKPRLQDTGELSLQQSIDTFFTGS